MFIATYETGKGDTLLALAKTEAEAKRLIAAKHDEYLKRFCGDENRERFLVDLGYVDAEDPKEAPTPFGTDLDWYATVLDEWSGIRTTSIKLGEAVLPQYDD